tara:strand:- start:8717 stop:11266 length:2550 start_codon:yes stop_codon:yes gene_type:complete
MTEFAREILPISLEDEMQNSYLEYAMSVIVGRALPDARDGLKPVHRRVLYAMSVLNNDYNKPYKKSARVVGDVIGKYHPHGDTAVYDTIVRMAQPFSLRYMLVDGQGNFGSVDGDSPAAMRYTEVRMSKIAHELLSDIDKDTVDFASNYDESEHEPTVLPAKIPNLLINGSSGIAVGMATNIPPHNLSEVIDGCLLLINNSETELDQLMECIAAPDFPTAGIINGMAGVREAYETGRGKVYIRARTVVENIDNHKQRIVVTELPYQVNKARLLEKIAELVKDKKIDGITELRDESDKDGMRMVIELRRGEVPEVTLNNLFKQTQMQSVFGINIVALVDNQPKTLNLKQLLEYFIRHRRDVVTRRTLFELKKARSRAHILEGLAIALANISEVIDLIKSAPSPSDAREKLKSTRWKPGVVETMLKAGGADSSRPESLGDEFGLIDNQYKLTGTQAQAILDLRLQKLTGLEQEKILEEFRDILKKIESLLKILEDSDQLMQVIRDELIDIKEQFGDQRRSEIVTTQQDLTLEDLITEEDVVVTLSHEGYVKSQPVDVYQAQRRGGKGKAATATKDEDFIEKLFVANTHDTILCFSSHGKCYWLKVFELPQAGRNARGKPMVNLLPLEKDERINAILPIREYTEEQFVFMATAFGIVKKTPLTDFSRPRSSGIIAVDLKDGDNLIGVDITDGNSRIMLSTSSGKAIRFEESNVRAMGRTACGVKGIKMADGQKVISLTIGDEGDLLSVTENGFGKRTLIEQFPVKGRAGMGMISIKTSERNGKQIGAVRVSEDDEIMLITDGGTLVRTRVADVSQMSRDTQGVKVISLIKGEKLVGIERIDALDSEDSGNDL